MLHPTDLRIGNWVTMVSGTNRNEKSFLENRPIAVDEYFYSSAKSCFPIRITADILGKAGFKHDFGDWYKNMDADGIDEGLPFLRFKHKESTWYLRDVKIPAQPVFLHQLQNLVFALLNQELKIQLGHFDNLPSIAATEPAQ